MISVLVIFISTEAKAEQRKQSWAFERRKGERKKVRKSKVGITRFVSKRNAHQTTLVGGGFVEKWHHLKITAVCFCFGKVSRCLSAMLLRRARGRVGRLILSHQRATMSSSFLHELFLFLLNSKKAKGKKIFAYHYELARLVALNAKHPSQKINFISFKVKQSWKSLSVLNSAGCRLVLRAQAIF